MTSDITPERARELLSVEIGRIVFAFGDADRKDAIRALAERAREMEAALAASNARVGELRGLLAKWQSEVARMTEACGPREHDHPTVEAERDLLESVCDELAAVLNTAAPGPKETTDE